MEYSFSYIEIDMIDRIALKQRVTLYMDCFIFVFFHQYVYIKASTCTTYNPITFEGKKNEVLTRISSKSMNFYFMWKYMTFVFRKFFFLSLYVSSMRREA